MLQFAPQGSGLLYRFSVKSCLRFLCFWCFAIDEGGSLQDGLLCFGFFFV